MTFLQALDSEIRKSELELKRLARHIEQLKNFRAKCESGQTRPSRGPSGEQRKLYGQFMGIMRHLTPAEKEAAIEVRKQSGIEKGIEIAKSLLDRTIS
jgi:hypothetical protein